MLLKLVLATLLVTRTVSAGLFPTFPTTRSVLNAGHLIAVRWIDDEERPSINTMGPCRIDLFVANFYVINLGEGVDPKSGAANVWISPAWRHNGSNFYLRFTCEQPHHVAYTADFTVTGMSNLAPLDGPTIDAHNESAVSISYVSPRLTVVLPTATSTVKPISSPSQPSAFAPPLASLESDPRLQPGKTGSAAAGLRKRPTVDLERLKFRFVFIFWPTLIGITMAL
ncbi:hypothetical protein LXA43DRAFT_979611 [Ganoderma leucocontextum]|nr:hypothetical protein LXA43DRAFT_979611 [Ganoderma leucocontextum]